MKAILILTSLILLVACQEPKERIVSYHENGQLKHEVPASNGKPNGVAKVYYPNGKLEALNEWKDGELHGESRTFYESGRIKSKGNTYKGVVVDTAFIYWENGNLQQIALYDSSGRINNYRIFDEHGRPDYRNHTKQAIILSDADTVTMGQNFRAIVRLGNQELKHIQVHLGDYSDRALFMKTKPLEKSDSSTALVKIKADKPGLNIIKGAVLERSDKWDSIYAFPFELKFFVRPKN